MCNDAYHGGIEGSPGTGCCGSSCSGGKSGCLASEARIRTCMCQENVGCLDRADCGGFRPRGTAATGACPGPCQCTEEEAWNRNVPPKPNCEWLSNFSELRRQWSDHGRKNNCKCCSCAPSRRAAPCRPCLPPKSCLPPPRISACGHEERLGGGGCGGSPCDGDHRAYPGTSLASPCQPCAPAPRPILKPRSCCQHIDNFCMCQPMQRPCNCPPPVQVDARADRECTCECPSSPECACPPSERKFPRTKVRCPNAKLCPPTPRPQPGPKCNCSKCQPCLPPPCDPCTSTKCRPPSVKIQPCPPEPSGCNVTCSPCPRPSSPPCATPSRPTRTICATPCQRRPVDHGDDARDYADECDHRSLPCIPEESQNSLPKKAQSLHQCNCGDVSGSCAENIEFCCSTSCASETTHETKRISACSEGNSMLHKQPTLDTLEAGNQSRQSTESALNNPHELDYSQLRDLQRTGTSVENTLPVPARPTKLLSSLKRGKSSKAHRQQSNYEMKVHIKSDSDDSRRSF